MESSSSSNKKKAPKNSKSAKAKQGSKSSKKTVKASDKLDRVDKPDKSPSTPNPKNKGDKQVGVKEKEREKEKEKDHSESNKSTDKEKERVTESVGEGVKENEKYKQKEGEHHEDELKKVSDDGDVKMHIQVHPPEEKLEKSDPPAVKKQSGLAEMYTSMMTATTTATATATSKTIHIENTPSKDDKKETRYVEEKEKEREKSVSKSNGNIKSTSSNRNGVTNGKMGKTSEPGNSSDNDDDGSSSDSDGNTGDHSSDSDWTDDERKGIPRKRKRSTPGAIGRSKKSSKRSKIGSGSGNGSGTEGVQSRLSSKNGLEKDSHTSGTGASANGREREREREKEKEKESKNNTSRLSLTKNSSAIGSMISSTKSSVALPQFSISFAANSMPSKSIFETEVDESVKKCITDHLNKTVTNAMRIFEQKVTGIQPNDFEGKDSDKAMLPRATTAYVQSMERYIETFEQIFSHWNKFSHKVNPIVLLYDLHETVKYDEDTVRNKVQGLCVKMLKYFMNTSSVNDTNTYYLERVRLL